MSLTISPAAPPISSPMQPITPKKCGPFRNAVKAADSNAVVAVFYSYLGRGSNIWDNALGRYTDKDRDAVTYHYYPQPALTNFFDLMAFDNGILLSNTSIYVSNNLMASNSPNMHYMITEFQPVMVWPRHHQSTPQPSSTTLTAASTYQSL